MQDYESDIYDIINVERIILTGFLILKMGQINMNDLQADTSDIIKEILMCVVIAMTGMFGITGAMFTGNALYADSAGVYIYEAVITCVVVICISLPKIRKNSVSCMDWQYCCFCGCT